MSSQLTNYQCPSCTGPLHFDSESGMLQCDYCGSRYSVDEIEKLYQDKLSQAEQAAAEAAADSAAREESAENALSSDEESWNAEADGMKLYNCPACGAQLICDATTAATSCPYCGNPTVIPGQFHGMLKPDYILPFRITKEEAIIISSYTCEAKDKNYSPYRLLNKSLVSKNRKYGIDNVSKYIYILLTSLRKLERYYPDPKNNFLYRCIRSKTIISNDPKKKNYIPYAIGNIKTF